MLKHTACVFYIHTFVINNFYNNKLSLISAMTRTSAIWFLGNISTSHELPERPPRKVSVESSESPVLVIRTNTRSSKVQSAVRRSEMAYDNLFELWYWFNVRCVVCFYVGIVILVSFVFVYVYIQCICLCIYRCIMCLSPELWIFLE